mmetsp:Transcript_27138/g.84428  ORF Transcript_27138/g.84428 Transcript_27138/m.84428 type:complete len:282 (+) Transcript_27138:61-906(+)|eukprot:CAMPEP_0204594908 /NCGR_PEP_ID=MMETSP0661-20131031/52354_1 /ASSEMBLY_ACC=CAM_ASM_000606 /TAXON_ID=109239 /ORGANISM="Alexandrium margalefi, Strain AMGDE01CS-322" /LENGTH=281 /DNA_ID=CAMNT_0051605361 /DNA_START=60 /DNA_END=905 /DNA_ORIENTATION=+
MAEPDSPTTTQSDAEEEPLVFDIRANNFRAHGGLGLAFHAPSPRETVLRVRSVLDGLDAGYIASWNRRQLEGSIRSIRVAIKRLCSRAEAGQPQRAVLPGDAVFSVDAVRGSAEGILAAIHSHTSTWFSLRIVRGGRRQAEGPETPRRSVQGGSAASWEAPDVRGAAVDAPGAPVRTPEGGAGRRGDVTQPEAPPADEGPLEDGIQLVSVTRRTLRAAVGPTPVKRRRLADSLSLESSSGPSWCSGASLPGSLSSAIASLHLDDSTQGSPGDAGRRSIQFQ